MKRFLIFYYFLLASALLLYARNYTISGYVADIRNGESLPNASVLDLASQKGVVSNSSGFYSLTIPEGRVRLRYSYVGYTSLLTEFELTQDTILNIQLAEHNMLREVTVTGHYNETPAQSSQMGAINVPVSQIKAIPTLLGETDVIKAMQLLPGVQGGTEGTAGMYVRGGSPDQNLMLLDGVPVYNVDHALGLFSVFNADAIKNATLYKGNFPARFGGRLSSVVDLQTKDGDDKHYHGNASIGFVSAKVNVEGPIIKEKTTFNISARRTYIDLIAQPVLKLLLKDDPYNADSKLWLSFYDVNAKFTHKFSDSDRLFLSFYMGDDAISTRLTSNIKHNTSGGVQKDYTQLGWNRGNIVSSLRWNHVLSNKLFMNTTASFTRYRYDVQVANLTEVSNPSEQIPAIDVQADYASHISDWAGKVDFDYAPNPSHDIKFGAGYTFHNIRPRVVTMHADFSENISGLPDSALVLHVGDKDIRTHETALYAEDNLTLSRHIKANIGLHYSAYSVQKQFYHSLQPRLSARFLLTDRLSLKAGYAYMQQYIHLLSNSSVMLPTDLWVPATRKVAPLKSHQFTAGIFYHWNNIADLSVEAYYKSMNNLIEYKDGASFIGSTGSWEDKIASGRGWAYGIEFFAQRSFGKTTGWIAYTWAKSDRLFDRPGEELNFGRVFPAKYDRRHDFSITLSHKFNDRIDISANWLFSTGHCGTLATQEYPGAIIPDDDSASSPTVEHISARNNYRYENYHRLDFGINFHKQKRHGRRTWNISLYNMYNRMNPFLIFPRTEGFDTSNGQIVNMKRSLVKLSIFPIIPSVSYTFSF